MNGRKRLAEKHMDDNGLEYHFVVFDRKTGP